MSKYDISNSDDLIDSRNVIARIEELREESELDTWSDDDKVELQALETLASEAEGYAADWRYGETLIRDSYFETYAQTLAEDCGMIPADLAWPCTCIDWEKAARELQYDYTGVDFGGVTYWVRS